MSISADTAARARPSWRTGLAAVGLGVLTALAAAAPAQAGTATLPAAPALKVPVAAAGAKVIVTYRDAASYRAGGGTTAATETDLVPALLTKVFTPKAGLEQRAMRELAAQRGVTSIESDVRVESTATPNDPLWARGQKWAHDRVGIRQAWNTTKGVGDTVIAIVDSGIEASHPEFAGRVVAGYDFVENDSVPNDPRGHGTMTAGAAAARGNNGAGVVGPCWRCKIMPVRVLDANGKGYASWVVKAIIFATDSGADIISMSFGGFSPTASMAGAVAYARSKGVVVLASAGNNGNSKPFYPAAHPGVIGVAASDAANRPYGWSNRGSWAELTAPGCFWTTKTGKSYGNFCGTSASTPLVAGIVGLMRSARPDVKGYLLERAILSTASSMSYVSHGLPNAARAIRAALAIPKPPPPPAPTPAPPAPPPAPPATAHQWIEAGGQVVVEAERPTDRIDRGGSRWVDGTVKAGFVGGGYVMAFEDRGGFWGGGWTTRAPELQYRVRFATPGIYTLWFRTWAPDGGGDSVHAGTNGQALALTDKIATGIHAQWAWTRSTLDGPTARIKVSKPGVIVVNVWAREDGFRFDRIVITQGGPPVGKGPAESPTEAATAP